MKWFSNQKGFGFIQPEGGGPDVFVRISAAKRNGMSATGRPEAILRGDRRQPHPQVLRGQPASHSIRPEDHRALTTDVLAKPVVLGPAADASVTFHSGVVARRCGRTATKGINRIAERDDTQAPHTAFRSRVLLSLSYRPRTRAAPTAKRRTRMPLCPSTIRHLSPAVRKAERERDHAAPPREYAAESAAVQAKAARHRALRPAKQASDAQAAAGPEKKDAPAPRRGHRTGDLDR